MKKVFGRRGFSYIAVVLLFVMVLSMASGCASETAGASTTDESEANGTKELDYPKKPITIIVPMNPGGTSDIGFRLLQPYLEQELGVSVIIENKPGSSGQIGLTEGLHKPADGYTAMHVHQTLTSSSIIMQKAQYDLDDFAIVNTIHMDPECLAVAQDAPYDNLVELVNYIKEHPGEISASASSGSASFVLLNWLRDTLELDFNIVPYKSGAPARVACIGGHTNLVGTTVADIYTDIDSLKAIAVGGKEENSLYPGVKTVGAQLEEFGIDPETVPSMPSWRSLAFSAEFKEEYPERWDFFVAAFERAYNNPEHMAAVEKVNLSGIMHICDSPEEATKEFEAIHETFKENVIYLKN